ncbi:MAG: HAMP domain-containing histidine kinase [Provencibacterium sp.]|jgi:OmpR-family two-component system manganese-sensing sensor histidine kinase|nr:HAMP domain-containing histidine kinase [Provencibacterium sp.]
MFKRLRLRLTLICTLITGIILSGMAAGALLVAKSQQAKSSAAAFGNDYNAIIYHLQNQTVVDRSWLSQTESGNRLVIHIEDNGTPLLFSGSWETATSRPDLVAAAKNLAQQLGFDTGAPPQTRISADGLFFTLYGRLGERYQGACAAVPTPLGWISLILLKDMRAEDAQSALQSWLFLGLVALGTVLLFVFSWWFTGRSLRTVEENQRRQAEFVAAASHELRTPLAVMEASVSAIEKATPEETERFTGILHKECQRMSRLVSDMLSLARADAKTWSLSMKAADADTLLLTQYELFEKLAAEKRIALSANLDDSAPLPRIYGDEQRLSQVLAILIDNAVSYTPPGGEIRLGAAGSGNLVRLSVADNGPGIPEEAKPHIFERFYRADPSRSGKNHHGLGLSIAQEIISLHHGKIYVQDGPGGRGSVFTVELPAYRPENARNDKKGRVAK